MKKIGLIFVFVMVFLAFLVQAGTTFFDNPDDFFIMGGIPEDGADIHYGGGGSSGERILSGIPDDTGNIEDKEEFPEEDELDGKNLFNRLTFLVFFFLATFFVLYTQKIVFRLLRV